MNNECVKRQLSIEVIVGAFMVMILLGLGYFTIILSRDTFFTRKYNLDVVFRHVMGLREGDNVVVRGMPVGKVQTLTLNERGVHVVLRLDQPVPLREDYAIRVVTTSMLGGKHLEIAPGTTNTPALAANRTLLGETPVDLLSDAADAINAVKHSLIEGGVLTNIEAGVRDLRLLIGRVERGEGTLGKLFSPDDTLYRDLGAGVASLRAIGERLERGEGTLGKLLAPDTALYDDLRASVGSLRSIADRLERGEGTLGKLLSSDDALYNDLRDSVASLKTVATRIEKGEGSLGRLINDESLYTEVEATLGEVRAAIDDFRETAPITTFSSLFFGAF